IADQCHFDFKFDTYYFPQYALPEGESLEEHLKKNVYEGFEERWPAIADYWGERAEEQKQNYLNRIQLELDTVVKMGFAGYFLIVADFINYAKSQDIPVGPGRGSAAGSLVAYCIKITDLDPIPYHLLFERFLNPERISMPDMDIDFCMNRRDEVIKYVNEKYGNVSQIITFGKMKAKAVVRDVGRVMDMPYSDVDKIAKLIPNALNITLEEALKTEPRLQELEKSQPTVKRLLNMARSLEGLNRHASMHAAGVVISDRPLSEFMPLYRGPNEEVVTQYDMKYVEKIGLVKFDFLGLKTLTVLDDTLKIIKNSRNETLDLSKISLSDAKVYKTLSAGDGLGIFQLESSGMRDLLIKMKPSCFEDLIALVALYRPGPLGSGMVDDFINRKHGRTPITYELPQLEPILKDTYGVIVYQEQVMQIASALAGYSLGEADLLRRAMGKKKPEEMAKQRDRFLEGAKKLNVPLKKAEKIFDLMAKFAEYGFNKSHSAAYALISYQTAYLKTHYTAEFMASLLTLEMGDTDKILVYINDLQSHGIEVLPPDVNESMRQFSVINEKQIRFGLAAVKNVGDAAIESIIEARSQVKRFESFFHFCEVVDQRRVNRKVIESMIKCGAFDNLRIYRSQAMDILDQALNHGSTKQKDRERGQNNLFDQVDETIMTPAIPEISEWPEQQRLKIEKEAIGFYITGHPLKEYEERIRKLASVNTQSIREVVDKSEVVMAGMVSTLKEIQTKKGDRMAFVTLEDLHGTLEVVVFSDVYSDSQPLLAADEPILIKGQVDMNEESVKLLATQITALKGEVGVYPLRVKISSKYLDEKKLKTFKLTLSRFPGKSPVYLHLVREPSHETILRLPRELDAQWNAELQKELETLLGQRAEIQYGIRGV
ncbi:MAG: DNA polymerase III subunit alpha, partial [Deltaproteobacteria bacterium]|nr:DNA polymerase III subunit alpha [Deltaproteobacteria bacterium]